MKITESNEGGERHWMVGHLMAINIEQLESLAEAIEEGEIELGAGVFRLDALIYDQLDPELLKRLGKFIERKP